jgi:CxxC-x17-CxxC domain-containing protein
MSAAGSYWVIIGNSLFNYSSQQIEVIIMYQKPMFEIKCTDCGNTTTVPFKPTPGKPVYCRTCFSKHVTKRPESDGGGNSGFAQKQVWARRRENGHPVKEEQPVSVFQRL